MPIADVSAYASDMSTCVMGRCGETGEMWDGTCPPALGEIWGDVPRDGEICRDVSTCVKTCRRRSFSQFIREVDSLSAVCEDVPTTAVLSKSSIY